VQTVEKQKGERLKYLQNRYSLGRFSR